MTNMPPRKAASASNVEDVSETVTSAKIENPRMRHALNSQALHLGEYAGKPSMSHRAGLT